MFFLCVVNENLTLKMTTKSGHHDTAIIKLCPRKLISKKNLISGNKEKIYFKLKTFRLKFQKISEMFENNSVNIKGTKQKQKQQYIKSPNIFISTGIN